jgi:hypothetical protein
MKTTRVLLILALALSFMVSMAKAVPVNPITWDYSLVTFGARDDWDSTTNVVPTFAQYDYSWELTQADIEVAGSWFSIIDIIAPEDKAVSGTIIGPLPAVDELIVHLEYPEIAADILVSVDEEGYGRISVDNIGWAPPAAGARLIGNVTVTGVPEPATVALVGLGGMAMLRKRRL